MKTSNRSTARGLWRWVGVIMFLVACLAAEGALQGQRPTAGEIAGVVQGGRGAGSRRLGHRRDQGSADQLHQDRRHRRSGAVRGAGAAGRQLQRVGARIRPGRFDAGRDEAGRDSVTLTRAAAKTPQEAAKVLSGQLLALAARAAGQRASSPAPVRQATASARACRPRTTGSTRSSRTAISAISSATG